MKRNLYIGAVLLAASAAVLWDQQAQKAGARLLEHCNVTGPVLDDSGRITGCGYASCFHAFEN